MKGWAVAAVLALAVVVLTVLLISRGQHQPATVAAPAPAQASADPNADPHAAHASARATVDVQQDWAERLGLVSEPARIETVARSVRVAATVVPDEARIRHLHARVSGWVEEVRVDYTGQAVRRGQPLVSVFSQDLYASQLEYLAARARSAQAPASAVLAASRERLRVLGMSESQIKTIEASGTPQRNVVLHAPHDGIVLRRSVFPGTAVDPSTELVTLADLSVVWVVAELAEQDAALARLGAAVRISLAGSDGQAHAASLDYIAPTASERTRGVRVRAALDNPDGSLRPGLSGWMELQASEERLLTVPREAVVDTGPEQYVYVEIAPARFEPRRVQLGARLPTRIAVLDGIAEGEPVLSSGVFLVDSESRLRASGAGPGHAHGAAAATADDDDEHAGHRR
jgi:membrane fusion protein, copper/silver efflux system